MPRYFNFQRLIEKYSRPFTVVVPGAGGFDALGDYRSDEDRRELMYGAILSHRQNKVFRSEGTLTEQDRALYLLSPLPACFLGAVVEFQDRRYRIASELENGEFTGVYAYTLKYESAFDEEGGDEP